MDVFITPIVSMTCFFAFGEAVRLFVTIRQINQY